MTFLGLFFFTKKSQKYLIFLSHAHFWRFKVMFETKAAKMGDFGHLNIMFGHLTMSI